MDAKQAIEKITKLLALSASDNPGEASNALLMARKLMAQFKLSEQDLETSKPCKLKKIYYEDLTYSGLRNMWMPSLARAIANHHCCGFVARHATDRSTVFTVGFVGLDEDPELAKVIFDYAVQHIRNVESTVRKELYRAKAYSERYINTYVKQYVTNYGNGFAKGLRRKYMEQNAQESQETALVMVQPKEVSDFLGTLKQSNIKFQTQPNNGAALEAGYQAGYSFDPTRQINTSKKEERMCLSGSRS